MASGKGIIKALQVMTRRKLRLAEQINNKKADLVSHQDLPALKVHIANVERPFLQMIIKSVEKVVQHPDLERSQARIVLGSMLTDLNSVLQALKLEESAEEMQEFIASYRDEQRRIAHMQEIANGYLLKMPPEVRKQVPQRTASGHSAVGVLGTLAFTIFLAFTIWDVNPGSASSASSMPPGGYQEARATARIHTKVLAPVQASPQPLQRPPPPQQTLRDVNGYVFAIPDHFLTIREQPSTRARTIGQFERGVQIVVTGIIDHSPDGILWYRVRTTETTGFIAANINGRWYVSRDAPRDRDTFKVDDFDRDTDVVLMARMLFGECDKGAKEEKIEIAWTVLNRKSHPIDYGDSVRAVILKPSAYSCFNTYKNGREEKTLKRMRDPYKYDQARFNECLDVAQGVLSGKYKPRLQGMTHYYLKGTSPWWKDKKNFVGHTPFGYHVFCREIIIR